ncbi:MAG TPA: transcription antitermination factor NusB [Patescibacteria group bacterium]|nr:transcription antitermination factor NusB [Patescibacteria group bacterium]
MANRHLARTIAMQTLFEWDFRHGKTSEIAALVEKNLKEFAPEFKDNGFTKRLVAGVVDNQKEIDEFIKTFAPEWPLDQITTVDRNILRLGVYELKISPDIPPKVAINESIELAKTFGGDSSGKFVNGVLGSIFKKMEEAGLHKIPQETCAGGVVVRYADGLPLILLILDPYNQWTFPKGHLEENESVEDAALREVQEETGIQTLLMKEKIGIVEYTVEKKQEDKKRMTIQKIVHYYLMETPDEKIVVEKGEAIKDGKWYTTDEALKTFGYENTKSILKEAVAKITNNNTV